MDQNSQRAKKIRDVFRVYVYKNWTVHMSTVLRKELFSFVGSIALLSNCWLLEINHAWVNIYLLQISTFNENETYLYYCAIFLNSVPEMKVHTEIMNTITAIHIYSQDNDWTVIKLLQVNPNVQSLHN